MRHLCKEHLSEVADTTMYKKIDAGLLNKVVDKVSNDFLKLILSYMYPPCSNIIIPISYIFSLIKKMTAFQKQLETGHKGK